MRNDQQAETVVEAEAQQFTLPRFKDWRSFAGLMNGYSIATELGLDFHAWAGTQIGHWEETGAWNLDVLHLRLMLFYAFRADHMTGYTYTEHDDMADSLLHELSQQLNLPYEGKANDG
jgi:hypothetical protein